MIKSMIKKGVTIKAIGVIALLILAIAAIFGTLHSRNVEAAESEGILTKTDFLLSDGEYFPGESSDEISLTVSGNKLMLQGTESGFEYLYNVRNSKLRDGMAVEDFETFRTNQESKWSEPIVYFIGRSRLDGRNVIVLSATYSENGAITEASALNYEDDTIEYCGVNFTKK